MQYVIVSDERYKVMSKDGSLFIASFDRRGFACVCLSWVNGGEHPVKQLGQGDYDEFMKQLES